ncbi:hypothetical protein ACM64Y_06465 [Novispirillum sp. DQ9]|uniref:hypothetical protein n=1 Tax=Novispirillum sp. DQ9 TaxID=3398612 RepID=UPI003C7C78EC
MLCFSDTYDDIPQLSAIFDDVLTIHDFPQFTAKSWLFGRNIVEMCTAIKGAAAERIFEKYNPDILIYMDPDTKYFSYPVELMRYLDYNDIILTPHMCTPSSRERMNIELACMRHGAYNLGFLALRNTANGRDFSRWWADRLVDYCLIDVQRGIFTDQKLVDLAPCFFDRLHVMRETNYNLATWNMEHRRLRRVDTEVFVDDRPLRFFHFAGSPGDRGLNNLINWFPAKAEIPLSLWDGYTDELNELMEDAYSRPWTYTAFSSGTKITDPMRKAYREKPALKERFPDPFDSSGSDSFEAYWASEESK